MIRAYFDDSGTHWQSDVTAIGGFIGHAADWDAFEADWQAVLDDVRAYGITAFHATDCLAGKGDFVRLQGKSEVCSAISRRFARVIGKHSKIRFVWATVLNPDWDDVVDEPFRERYEKPFGLCFEWCVTQLTHWARRYGGGRPVDLVCSEQNDFQERMHEIYRWYTNAKLWAPLSSLTFASYRSHLPLQAADQGATEIMRYWRDAKFSRSAMESGRRMRPELKAIADGQGLHLGGCYDKSALRNAVRSYRANLESEAAAVEAARQERRARRGLPQQFS